MTNDGFLYVQGDKRAPILVLTEPPEAEAYDRRQALSPSERRFFRSVAEGYGFDLSDFAFLPCAIPMPEGCDGDKEQAAHLAQDREEFLELLDECTPRMIIATGRHALRQLTGRAVQIGKARGRLAEPHNGIPVLPLSGIRQCLWFPENIGLFVSDFNMVDTLDRHGYDPACLEQATEHNTDYQWTLDLSELCAPGARPKWLAIDTETTGLEWTDPRVRVLTVQFTPREGVSRVALVDEEAAAAVFPDMDPAEITRAVRRVRAQVKDLSEDEGIKKILSNAKFDAHMMREKLGVQIKGWSAETQQLAFCADDNMLNKGLDEVTRRWVPQLAGYADSFNDSVDKFKMLDLLKEDPDKFLRYAGADTDASYRAARALLSIVKDDPLQFNTYRAVQLPALQAFGDRVETTGLVVDRSRLADLQEKIEAETAEVHTRVLSQLPRKLRRKHYVDGLSLTRAALQIDALFTREGLGLQPVVFTKSSRGKSDEEKVASTSAKQHLIYFAHEPLVEGIMRWGKLEKMRTTYVGKERDNDKGGIPTGFWKHLVTKDGVTRIYPSFYLHRTSTGRTASSNPNAQNFPKRGDLAKAFRSIFLAPPGWTLVEADLSQAELRIAACEAGETNMIDLYRRGVDIHANTGALVSKNDPERVLAHKKDKTVLLDVANDWPGSGDYLRKLTGEARRTATVADFIAQLRYQAKAVNFGFLYGMQWAGFKTYAKVEYGIDYTDEDCMRIRDDFFSGYPRLLDWHERVEREVYEHGMIRSLHGAIRHLPSIYSVKRSVQREAVRQAINSPVQRFASDLGIMALWRICRDAPREYVRPAAFIHDALLLYVRDDKVAEVASAVRFYMENNPLKAWFDLELPLPIVADVSIGKSLDKVEETAFPSTPPEWWNQRADEEAPRYIYQTLE